MAASATHNPHSFGGAGSSSRPRRRDYRIDGPKWAEGLTPEEVMNVEEARRLPLDTDPDDITDPEVRREFVNRMLRIDADERAPGDDPEADRADARRERVRGAGSRGGAAARRAAGAIPTGRPTLVPPARLRGGDGAGFAFGLLLYALFINYVRYGPEGVKAWFGAKFFNREPRVPAPGAPLPRHDPAVPVPAGVGTGVAGVGVAAPPRLDLRVPTRQPRNPAPVVAPPPRQKVKP